MLLALLATPLYGGNTSISDDIDFSDDDNSYGAINIHGPHPLLNPSAMTLYRLEGGSAVFHHRNPFGNRLINHILNMYH